MDPQDESHWKQCNAQFCTSVNCLGEEHGEKGYAHAPVCLQVVGSRWEDENVVEALGRIEKAMGRRY
jgi:Asp-tRNA(Asn)/Glu-tRNA(Gln) amidotransferase A subunit family amidase